MNSLEFVNNFNDYLKKNTKESYNDKYFKNSNLKKNFNSINYSDNYSELLKKKYGNNLIINNNNNKSLCNYTKILDINNYKKCSCLKSDINGTKYSNNPFEYDNFHYLI